MNRESLRRAWPRVWMVLLAMVSGLAVTGTAAGATRPACAYVTESAGKVSVVNTATNAVTGHIPVGSGAYGIAASPDGSRLYVATRGPNTVSVINAATNTVTRQIPVDYPPFDVAVTPDGHYVYVTHMQDHAVSVINTVTNTVTRVLPTSQSGTSPAGIAISPDGRYAYVTNAFPNAVRVIATATNLPVGIIKLPAIAGAQGVVVSRDDSRLYVADNTGRLYTINTATHALGTLTVGGRPHYIAQSPDGSRLYISNSGDHGSVSVFHPGPETFDPLIPTGLAPLGIAVTPDGRHVYVARQDANEVSVIDTADHKVSAVIPGIPGASHVAFSPAGRCGPELAIRKRSQGVFKRGGHGTYLITVASGGVTGTDGTLVTLRDDLPRGLRARGLSGVGWHCHLAGLTCERRDALAPEKSYPPVTLHVAVACDAPGVVTNVATVTGGGDPRLHTATAHTAIHPDRCPKPKPPPVPVTG